LNHKTHIISMLETISSGLKSIISEIVFVGGSVIPFYIEDEAVEDIRVTDDVDCVFELLSRTKYYELEEKLSSLGFKHSLEKDAPVCRWIYESVKVDIMPTDEAILGFSNQWFKKGFHETKNVVLPNGLQIKILNISFFIAAKIETFRGRGNSDFRISHDIEDIITVLDGQKSFDKFYSETNVEVKLFLKSEFKLFLESDLFAESIIAHLGSKVTSYGRRKRLLDFLENFINN